MIIALDYDDTFTACKPLWTDFALSAIAQGHTVVFVTFRCSDREAGNEDIEQDAERLGIDVVYSERRQKQDVFAADVWIDDNPQLIPSIFRRVPRRKFVTKRRSRVL